METPIDTLLRAQAGKAHTRFCMPGHKGTLSRLDVTEAGEMDNLLHPEGALVQAQTLLAQAYGAGQAFFGTCGSTMGMYALVLSAIAPGDLLLISSDCHISAVNAALLAQARVAMVNTEQHQGLPAPATADAVQQALQRHPEAKALVITSPNYYGVCANVPNIARLCRDAGTLLLVDAAHGAHFGSAPLLPRLPVEADGWVSSAHKTLCVENQGSLVFVGTQSRLDPWRVTRNVHRFQTTSPSWPLLAEMDRARATRCSQGAAQYAALYRRIQTFVSSLEQSGVQAVAPDGVEKDFTRVVLDVTDTGLSGYEAEDALAKKGVWVEMADTRHLVLICTPQDDDAAFLRLSEALRALPRGQKNAGPMLAAPQRDSEVFTPASVEYGTIKSVLLENSAELVSAAAVCCYPPGIAVLCPGERITQAQIDYLARSHRLGASVSGCVPETQALCVYVSETVK